MDTVCGVAPGFSPACAALKGGSTLSSQLLDTTLADCSSYSASHGLQLVALTFRSAVLPVYRGADLKVSASTNSSIHIVISIVK